MAESDLDTIEALLVGDVPEDEEDETVDYDELGWNRWLNGNRRWTLISSDFMARTVHTKGGSEGLGEHVEIVVEVSSHIDGIQKFSMESRFFKKLGYYGSGYGCDFDGDFDEVRPQLKTITVYEKE